MDSTPSVRRGVYARRPGAISVITGIRWNEQPVNARGYISKYCDLTPITARRAGRIPCHSGPSPLLSPTHSSHVFFDPVIVLGHLWLAGKRLPEGIVDVITDSANKILKVARFRPDY